MAEVTLQRTGEFVRKLTEILISHSEGLKAQDALNAFKRKSAIDRF